MSNIVTAEQMKQIESNALQYGFSFQRMMENAGSAAATFIRKKIDIRGKNCMVFCGKGNNGGDGLVVARKFIENGANVTVVFTESVPLTNPAEQMLEYIVRFGTKILTYLPDKDEIRAMMHDDKTDIIIDAIYGIGFRGTVNELYTEIFELINSTIAAVFSLDLPSGIVCDTADISATVVKADFTIAFDSMKPAHILLPSKEFCGEIVCVDIGIPIEAKESVVSKHSIITQEMVFEVLKKRPLNSHKGNFGRLLNISGSVGMSGAAVLSTSSALRCGVGYVTLATAKTVSHILAAKLIESLMLPLDENEFGTISASSIPTILARLESSNCVLIGCGLGQNEDTEKVVLEVFRKATCPIIVDADGINIVARNINILKEVKVPVVLTPHIAEMSRLTGKSIAEVVDNRYSFAKDFAIKYGVTLVMKGAGTIVASPKGVMVNQTGNAGLAKAGSGDVLAGMIGAFAAQEIDPYLAAGCGVYLHGLAGDYCANRLSQYGMCASDILEDLCKIFLENDR